MRAQGEDIFSGAEFLEKLDSIKAVAKSQIKELLISLDGNPDPENLWILSRFIRICKIQDLIQYSPGIAKIVSGLCHDLEPAAFAAANLINRMFETNRDLCSDLISNLGFPTDPLNCAKLVRLIAQNGISLDKYYGLLSFPDINVQKQIATAISYSSSEPEQFLKYFFEEASKETDSNTKRGFIYAIHALSFGECPSNVYADLLFPILEVKTDKLSELTTARAAQELLTDLFSSNQSAFHPHNIFPLINTQFENNNLLPEFLKSTILAYGKASIRELAPLILSKALTNCIKYKNLIEPFCPYTYLLDDKSSSLLFNSLTADCEKYRSDYQLLEMNVTAHAAAAPTVPSTLGRLMSILESSQRFIALIGKLNPLLEPKVPPPPQKISTITFLLDEDKHDQETQAEPLRCDQITQYEEQKETIEVGV